MSLQHDRPREEECDLEVEQDEEDRDEVVAHVELHARVLERLEAALVRRELLACPGFWEPASRASTPLATTDPTPTAMPMARNSRIGKVVG